jgi:hypothetical protein
MNAGLRASMPKHALIPTGRTGVSQSPELPQSQCDAVRALRFWRA